MEEFKFKFKFEERGLELLVLRNPDKFWRRVDRTGGPDACWEWAGSRTPPGYGHLVRGYLGRSVDLYAHRVAFALSHGSIDPSLDVMHSCDNPPCCNPAHLKQGTAADNMRDRDLKGRCRSGIRSKECVPRGEAHWQAKLTAAAVTDIRAREKYRGLIRDLAKEYGISRAQIDKIRRRQVWQHLP